MAEYKQEIEHILSRLKSAGVEVNVKEELEITNRYAQLVKEWRVPTTEAARTVIQASLKAHGIETRYWQTGGTAPMVTIDQVKADNEWLSMKAKVVQLWDNRSDKVCKTGLIGDGTGVIKFTVFEKNSDIVPNGFQEGASYLFENMVSSVWQGQFSVKGNKNSKITPLTEEIGVSRKTEALTGVITAIQSGSGLIKRCPECNRALTKGSCGEHGKVDGIFDLRIKAVFSPFGTDDQIDLIIGTEPTEKYMNLSIQEARELAAEALDAGVVADAMKKQITGRYYKVTGAMLQSDSMLVENIEPVNVCAAASLATAHKEIGGN